MLPNDDAVSVWPKPPPRLSVPRVGIQTSRRSACHSPAVRRRPRRPNGFRAYGRPLGSRALEPGFKVRNSIADTAARRKKWRASLFPALHRPRRDLEMLSHTLCRNPWLAAASRPERDNVLRPTHRTHRSLSRLCPGRASRPIRHRALPSRPYAAPARASAGNDRPPPHG